MEKDNQYDVINRVRYISNGIHQLEKTLERLCESSTKLREFSNDLIYRINFDPAKLSDVPTEDLLKEMQRRYGDGE